MTNELIEISKAYSFRLAAAWAGECEDWENYDPFLQTYESARAELEDAFGLDVVAVEFDWDWCVVAFATRGGFWWALDGERVDPSPWGATAEAVGRYH